MSARRSRLIWKLYAGFVGVACLGAGVSGVMVDRNVQKTSLAELEHRLDDEATMLGQMTATALFGELEPGDNSLNEGVTALGNAVHTHLSLLSASGVVVADSERKTIEDKEPDPAATEIERARADGHAIVVRGAQPNDRMWVVRAIVRDGKVLGFARASIPMATVRAERVARTRQLLFGAAGATGIALLLGFLLAMRIVRPVRALAAGARRIGAGEYGEKITIGSTDEIGELAAAFNEMAEKVGETLGALDDRAKAMRRVLDNVSEGLLTLDAKAEVVGEQSAMVGRWLGEPPPSRRFSDWIGPHDALAASAFDLQWEQIVDQFLPLDVCIAQLPARFVIGESTFALAYTPILDGEKLTSMLVVISDVTAKLAAERAESEQRETLAALERVMRDRAGFLDFVAEADALLTIIDPRSGFTSVEVKRALHTLKGNAALFGIESVAWICHELEAHYEVEDSALSVDDFALLRERWTSFMGRLRGLIGERDGNVIELDDVEYRRILEAVMSGLPRTDMLRIIGEWKLESMDRRLARFGDQARVLARRLGRGEIEIEIDARRVRAPREVLAPLWAAFAHLIRNSVDHGMTAESMRQPGDRKPKLRLAARASATHVTIEVSDNGRGIDWEIVRGKAASRGLPHETQEDLESALFDDGFSTADQVTEISGRGVGLAAVREAVLALNGQIIVMSEPGVGTTFELSIPTASLAPRRFSRLPPRSIPVAANH